MKNALFASVVEKKSDAYHKDTKIGLSTTAQHLSRLIKKIMINVLETLDDEEIILFDLPVRTLELLWQLEMELKESKKKKDALVIVLTVIIFVLWLHVDMHMYT